MAKKILKSLDYSIIVIVVILFAIGIVALYSANGGFEGDIEETIRQAIWFGVGLLLMIMIIFIDYDIFAKLWIPIYILTTLALVRSAFHRTSQWSN